ncbi:PDZ domain-containing protein [Rhodanobacter umsongensis]|uniref:PDZ domain-containing protein n=1 Tax=Rhodanobacter umsongensis TaxID=633153 RepID=A0ABW0JIQ5_9GAMM
MQRFAAVVACVFAVCLSPALCAQSPASPVTRQAFSYCSVTDTASHKVWASPVFEYAYLPDGRNQFTRTQDMASEFHAFVGSMGGAGDKACVLANGGRAEIEAHRNEIRAIMTKRFMGMVRAHRWMDVPWTPAPWSPATVAAKPAAVTRYFYCVATDADLRKTVAALVFEMSVDGSSPVTAYTQAAAYGKEFARDVAAPNGLAQGQPDCYFKDTRAEAEKALHDYRKMFSGFNLKFTDVAWRPAQESAATVTAAAVPSAPTAAEPGAAPAQGTLGIHVGEVSPTLALALGMDRARGALVVEVLKGRPAEAAGIKPMDVVLGINQQAVNQFTDLPVMVGRLPAGTPVTLQVWRERSEHEVSVGLSGRPAAVTAQTGTAIAPSTDTTAAVTAAPAAGISKYCHVFMQFVSKPGGVHSKVWENRDSDGSEAAMMATLAAFTAHMHQQQPKVWHEFAGRSPKCDMNLGYCHASVVRHFGGTSQIAGQFCKRSREEAEADWARLTQGSPEVEIVAWPVAS